MKKHNNSGKKSEPTSKRAKPQGPMRRDTKEVLAELVGKLKESIRTAKHTVDGGRETSLEIVRPVSASGSKLWV